MAVEASTSGLFSLIALGVLALLSGADTTAVGTILSDVVEVYLPIAVVVMTSLVILHLPR